MDPLFASLLDLLYELQGREIPLTVGGGFGLFLKRRQIDSMRHRTLFDRLPEPRSTNDLDLFLRTEILTELDRTREVADAIARLGYVVVEAAKYLQWTREVSVNGVLQQVKIDILVGPLGNARKRLSVSMPRVRPKGDIRFHAHAVEEALHVEHEAIPIALAGERSNGEPYADVAFAPHPFPYLMMKLHAFDDRRRKAQHDKQRQHALDLYAIVGMMIESEYKRAKELGSFYEADAHVGRARAIVRDHFAGPTAIGPLRIREHPLYGKDFQMADFIAVMGEIFPSK